MGNFLASDVYVDGWIGRHHAPTQRRFFTMLISFFLSSSFRLAYIQASRSAWMRSALFSKQSSQVHALGSHIVDAKG